MKWQPRSDMKFSKNNDVTKFLLQSRGISFPEKFLNPDSSVLHDAYLLKNIEDVCNRILKAISKNEKIVISADCDSDGVFSTAFMARYLKRFTDNLSIIYSQRSEGHGIENQIEFIPSDTQLLIILDSSTNSTEACREIGERGIDIVILDHHDLEQDKPFNVYATIVNPKLDDTYPNKNISGVGVVYKIIQVLDDSLASGQVDEYLDLVACGMYADMMPVDVLENRYLIISGMRNIKNTGLKAILQVNNIEPKNVNSQTIGFTISPLINGAARKDAIELGIELLTSDDMDECIGLVNKMKLLNEERRREEKELYENYIDRVDTNDKVLIAIDENASKNYNGLIANKFSQEFKRPSIVMREHEGSLAGSYRSYGGFDMKAFLNQKPIKKLIKYAVGHDGAGGVGLKASNYHKFKEVLNKMLENVDFESNILYDIAIDVEQITTRLINEIEKFDYLTGQGFPPATFLVKGLFVEGNKDGDAVKVMGKNRDTIKINCDSIDVIKFKVNEHWGSNIDVLDSIDVIGQLKLNEWIKWNGDAVLTNQVVAEAYRIN